MGPLVYASIYRLNAVERQGADCLSWRKPAQQFGERNDVADASIILPLSLLATKALTPVRATPSREPGQLFSALQAGHPSRHRTHIQICARLDAVQSGLP